MQRKPTIGISIGNRPVLLKALADYASQYGWQLLDLRLTHFIIPQNPSPIGAIISHWPKEKLLAQCESLKIPIVKLTDLNTDDQLLQPGKKPLPWVLNDLRMDGRIAADYFAKRGIKHVAYVGNVPFTIRHQVFETLREESELLGMTCHLLKLPEELNDDKSTLFQHQEQIIGDWLKTLPRPLGLLAYHDIMGSKLCSICLFRELAVPEDIAILGTGNLQTVCESSPVPLSSIERDDKQVANQALLLMKRILEGQASLSEKVLVPPKGVVERQSTNVLAFDDPRVVKAVRFLWDNLSTQISVEDVVDEIGGSRRTLERAFQRNLGRGIKEELLRKRLERCAALLIDGDSTIAEIASKVGIESLAYLHKKFRQFYGVTPRNYRLNRNNMPSNSHV